MVRTWTVALAGLGFGLLSAGSAGAQARGEFGEKGQLIFSADRLVPFLGYTNNSSGTTTSGGSISLFYGNNSWIGTSTGAGPGAAGATTYAWGNPTFYTAPRLGFDYTVIANLTVGGNFVLAFPTGGNASSCTGNVCTQNDTPGGNVWGLTPRAGYIIGIPEMMAIWLRGGLSYYHANRSLSEAVPGCPAANVTDNSGVFGLDLEPQFVVTPVKHFAFEIGPTLDWGFAGNATHEEPVLALPCGSTTKTSQGYTSLFFGVTGGIFGWF
jgi:hypothetical protein